MFKSRIVNHTENPQSRFDFEIGVASNADPDAVRSLIEDTVRGLPLVIVEPAPMPWRDRIGDGAVFLLVTGWIDQRKTSLVRTKGEAPRLVKAAVEASGVEVPDATHRIAMLSAAPGHDTPPQISILPALDSAEAADVSGLSEVALKRFVDAEGNDPDAPDLLT